MTINDETEVTGTTGANAADFRVTKQRTLALAVLHWIELQYLHLEFRAVKRHRRSPDDEWWATFGDAARPSCRFTDILRNVLDGASPAAVVHHSLINEEPVPWQTIHYRAWWSDPFTARVWTIAFWLGWSMFGWFLVCLATPAAAQTVAQLAYWLLVAGIVIKRKALARRLSNMIGHNGRNRVEAVLFS
jgi:hypothetical protein